MKAKLVGGPYDGIELDHNDVNLYTLFNPVGLRKFIFMPPFELWDSVRRGDNQSEIGKGPIYELVRDSRGMTGVYDPTGESFTAAMSDEQEGRGPQSNEPPFTGAYYHCLQGRWALTQSGRFPVTDQKNRPWACIKIERQQAERADIFSGLGEEMEAHRLSGTTERLHCATVHCESPEELPIALADIID